MKTNLKRTSNGKKSDNHHNDGSLTLGGATIPALDKKKGTLGQEKEEKKLDQSDLFARLSIKYGFGCTPNVYDSVQSFQTVRNPAKDECCDRIVYKMGKKMCILNPEQHQMVFLTAESPVVTRIFHFNISNSGRYLSVCESTRHEREVEGKTQLSVFSLLSYERLNTCTYESHGEFIYSSFCGESKYIASFCMSENENTLILWHWEKEKIQKIVNIPSSVKISKISCPPSTDILIAVSGPSFLKLWSIGLDNNFKSTNLVPITKDKSERVIDQTWLTSYGNVQKVAVLVEFDSSDPHKRLFIYIFEALEESVYKENDQCNFHFELRQTIPIVGEGGHHTLRLNRIVCTPRGFVILGNRGYIDLYERSDEKKTSYRETCSLRIGDEENLLSATLVPSEECLVVHSDLTSRLISIPLSAVALKEELGDLGGSSSQHPSDLTVNGYHAQGIVGADIALQRPILVTISSDCIARVWNYETMICELAFEFGIEDPRAIAVHVNGFFVLISFKDHVRLYSILRNSLRLYRETILRSCQCLKFSSGCQFWAAASGLSVVVYDSNSFTQLVNFPGHLVPIQELQWARGDQAIFSCSSDGNVYGWDVTTGGRVNVNVASNQSSQITALTVTGDLGLFPPEGAKEKGPPRFVLFATRDGNIKVMEWLLSDYGSTASNAGEKPRTPFYKEQQLLEYYIPGNGGSTHMTSLLISRDNVFIICGTNHGDVRLYKWNALPDGGTNVSFQSFVDTKAHSSAVVDIKQAANGSVISVGEDGTVFVWAIEDLAGEEKEETSSHQFFANESGADSDIDVEPWSFNSSVVCLSTEDIEDHVQTLDTLSKQLSDTETKFQFAIRKLENENGDKVRKMVTEHQALLNSERAKYDALLSTFNDKIKEVQNEDEGKAIEHVKIVADLENKFERKLTEQLERYDALSEEMEITVQRNKVLREQQERDFKEKISAMKSDYEGQLRKYHADVKRLKEERVADEKAFKEILDQQEFEYEEELKTLIAAAAQKLKEEKDAHDAIRELTKSKLAKTKNVAEKLKEANASRTSFEAKSHLDKVKIQKLNETIEHYKKNLLEREEALAEKERVILELRNTTKTLENFRFVLDHRLQQLTAERGPITSHIEGLEKHVTAMYEELVNEHENKKYMQVQSEQKDQKLHIVSSDVLQMKNEVKAKEDYIDAFKRELSNIISSNSASKEFEEATKQLYRKYVIGDNIVGSSIRAHGGITSRARELLKTGDDEDADFDEEEDDDSYGNENAAIKGKGMKWNSRIKGEVEAELIENAKEADRRRAFVESNTKSLKHRLASNKRQADLENKVRLSENSNLMYECNELRWQVKDLERRLQSTETLLGQAEAGRSMSKSLPVPQLGRTGNSNVSSSQALEIKIAAGPLTKSLDIQGSNKPLLPIKDEPMPDTLAALPSTLRRDLPKLREKGRPNPPVPKSMTKLAKEMDSLAAQLDEAHKEKELFRSEAIRLRKLLAAQQKGKAEEHFDFPRHNFAGSDSISDISQSQRGSSHPTSHKITPAFFYEVTDSMTSDVEADKEKSSILIEGNSGKQRLQKL